jgi:uncharacterized protein
MIWKAQEGRDNMKGEERRSKILSILKSANGPIKGAEISSMFDVTRQVIVQDVALLRAEGNNIISTPQGYVIITSNVNSVRKVIAVRHGEENIKDELGTIIALGGRIVDVTIEHKIYGELTGMLMIKSMFDLEEFLNKLGENDSKPLSELTGGVHIHTIEADDEEIMKRILNALNEKGYLIS